MAPFGPLELLSNRGSNGPRAVDGGYSQATERLCASRRSVVTAQNVGWGAPEVCVENDESCTCTGAEVTALLCDPVLPLRWRRRWIWAGGVVGTDDIALGATGLREVQGVVPLVGLDHFGQYVHMYEGFAHSEDGEIVNKI